MSLVAQRIGHAYISGEWVLRNVDLTVGDGESIAIMGPSGSGKTTLIAAMGLLMPPTEGMVLIDGAVVPEGHSDRARLRADRFAWIFQTNSVLGRRTSLDNVALSTLVRGAAPAAAAARAREMLESVGLSSKVDQPVRTLSGGEVQRVCIARALAVRPRFLFADEPTGQLDRNTSDRVLDALWNARTVQTAVIVATHDRSVADRCDRVLQLEDGEVCSS